MSTSRPDILAACDRINEVRNLIECVWMAAGDISDASATGAIQAVAGIASERLLAIVADLHPALASVEESEG